MWWSTMAGRLEQAQGLDPAVAAVSGRVERVLPRGRLKDALHGTWLGHPLHPMLIAVPIGTWSSALLLDLTAGEAGGDAARRLVGAGVLAAVPTAAAGWADWSELGSAKRPKRVGLVHAGTNVLTIALFGASWLARRGDAATAGRALALGGAVTLAVGGYLGGHLSYAEAVGVNRNADEPSKPRDWTDAAAADDVVEGRPWRAEVSGNPVVLVRADGRLTAMSATCSHWAGPLDEGELVDGCLECPWHGSRFRLADGGVARGPATSPQRAYDVRTVEDRVQVRVRP